jgi:transposase
MARKALRVLIIEEIHRLSSLGLKERAIARALNVHRNTIRKYLRGLPVVELPEPKQLPAWLSKPS